MLGVALFATLYAATRGGSAQFDVRNADLAPLVATFVTLILVLFATHELIHNVVARWCGARPRFGINLVVRVLPALFTTAPGARFSRAPGTIRGCEWSFSRSRAGRSCESVPVCECM